MAFRILEPFGVHVTPNHFSSPIPSVRDLPDALFETQSDCVGLDWNVQEQKRYLSEVFPKFVPELALDKNASLSVVDAAVLHSMVRHHKPRKIVEIGSGASTQISANACLMNEKEGSPSELTAIEPCPNRSLEIGFPGLTRLRKEKAQAVEIEEFEDCDLLFVDSSHVVKTGSDVNYEQLEIVPRLKRGCLVHFHDIFLPEEYSADLLKQKHYFWSEQYLLWAFLLFNREFEIIWASRYMHLKHGAGIRAVFPAFEPDRHQITSFWIRRR